MKIILHSIKAAGIFTLGLLIFTTFLIVAEKADAQEQEISFNFTGAQQSFLVPPGVTSIHIQAWGAQGGNGVEREDAPGVGGLGGFAEGELAVTPGETIEIFVGGRGTSVLATSGGGGFNGGGNALAGSENTRGGGGGASDVRKGGVSLNDRTIVAAGGGGACASPGLFGGGGGGLTGDTAGGEGGTQESGGTGEGVDQGFCLSGVFGVGGSHGRGLCGGGGGGWYGGGSGCGGGGGSSFIDGVENGSTNSGVREGDGLIILTFTPEPRPIPTLSEWGLIAMAGILGLVGLLAVRRKKITSA